MSNSIVTTGVVAFSNMTKHDEYQGQSTGKYTLTITLDAAEAAKLEDMGVKVKDYEGTPQRKFSSKFRTTVVDLDDNPIETEIPYGSKVRVLFALGQDHPVHGPAVYMNRVRVVELADNSQEIPDEF